MPTTPATAYEKIKQYEHETAAELIERENVVLELAHAGALAPIDWSRIDYQRDDARGASHAVSIAVASDFAGFGDASESFKVGMMAATMQAILDLLDAWAPTAFLARLVLARAQVRLAIHGQPEPRRASSTMWDHHVAVEVERRGRRGLTDGHYKNHGIACAGSADRIAIFGGLDAEGAIVQSLSTAHGFDWLDYSAAVRPWRGLTVDGKPADPQETIADPVRWRLICDDGPHPSLRIRARAPGGLGTTNTPIVAYAGGGVGVAPSLVGVLASGAGGAARGVATNTGRGLVALGAALGVAGGVAVARRQGVL